MNARKMMLVVGGPHDGVAVEVEDYTYVVRLPLPMEIKPIEEMGTEQVPVQARFALYYRTGFTIQDKDGTAVQIEFLRYGDLSEREAIERRLLPDTQLSTRQ